MVARRTFANLMAALGISGTASPQMESTGPLMPVLSLADGELTESPVGHRHGGVAMFALPVAVQQGFIAIGPQGDSEGIWITRFASAALDASGTIYYGLLTVTDALAFSDGAALTQVVLNNSGFGSGWPTGKDFRDDVFIGSGQRLQVSGLGQLNFMPQLTTPPTAGVSPGIQVAGFAPPLTGIWVPRGYYFVALSGTPNSVMTATTLWTQIGLRE